MIFDAAVIGACLRIKGVKNVEGYELKEPQSPYNRVFDPEKCNLRLKNEHIWHVS
jgi:hypothetical protein